MMAAAWTVMAAVRWMANIDATGFVLIKSSCISWSRTPASRSATAYSEHEADAHISFMAKDKCAGCLPALCIIALLCCLFAIISRPPTPTDTSSTMRCFFVAFPHHFIPTAMDDYPPCKFREAWWICKYRRLFREQVHAELPAEIPCTFHQFTSLVLGTEDSL